MYNTPSIGLMAIAVPLTDVLALMIPIIAIVMGIGVGGWSIYLNYRKRRDMFALYHQERMAAIEKGIELAPLPDEFFREEGGRRHPRSPHSKLLTGLILLFFGLAMFCAMYFSHQGTDSLWSLIFIGVGAAFLIFYFAVDKKQADLIDAKREAELASGRFSPTNQTP
jgi:peptidoglycan/LPS O-acetylase OafA/YrhL